MTVTSGNVTPVLQPAKVVTGAKGKPSVRRPVPKKRGK